MKTSPVYFMSLLGHTIVLFFGSSMAPYERINGIKHFKTSFKTSTGTSTQAGMVRYLLTVTVPESRILSGLQVPEPLLLLIK